MIKSVGFTTKEIGFKPRYVFTVDFKESKDYFLEAAVPGLESPLAAPGVLGAPTFTLPQVDSGNLASTANSGSFGPGALVLEVGPATNLDGIPYKFPGKPILVA